MTDFESFKKIERIVQPIIITEKIHGSNAQILIEGENIQAGSRNRWITPEDDNFGFAKWVHENKEELIAKLKDGRHYGEWYGSGINAGYGMSGKRFALFNTLRYNTLKENNYLPNGVDVVPVLYQGPYTDTIVTETLDNLKKSGSVLVPGFMKPEGVVIFWTRTEILMKRTFEAEDEAWNYKKDRPKIDNAEIEAICAPFWQPLRLEKLLSRDEKYSLTYPQCMPDLVRAYLDDLTSETEIEETTLKIIKKNTFKAVKGMMLDKGYTA